MKKIVSTVYDQNLTKALRAGLRSYCFICRVQNGVIYVSNGFFAAIVTAEEYNEFVRPLTMRDPGDYMIRKDKTESDKPLDLRKVFTEAIKGASGRESLKRAPFDASQQALFGKGPAATWALFYDAAGDYVSAFNSMYIDAFGAGCEFKAPSANDPAVVYDCGHPVGVVLPVRISSNNNTEENKNKTALIASVRAYFATPAAEGDKTQELETLKAENQALNQELEAARKEYARLEEVNTKHCREIDKLNDERKAAEQKPAPKTAAEIIAARWTKDGITATVKGATTAAPVVWLAGVNKKQAAEVEAAGGAFSKKRNAYYFRVA